MCDIRELRNIIQSIATAYDGAGRLRLSHFPKAVLQQLVPANGPHSSHGVLEQSVDRALRDGASFNHIIDTVWDVVVQRALRLSGGRSRRAAVAFGVWCCRACGQKVRPSGGRYRAMAGAVGAMVGDGVRLRS